MATTRFPIVFEREESGVVSAYVAGLPVYAQGATMKGAERAIQKTLEAYLEAHPGMECATAVVKVATVHHRARTAPEVSIVGAAALVGSHTSERKAASSRENGRRGGRPKSRNATDQEAREAGRRVTAKRRALLERLGR